MDNLLPELVARRKTALRFYHFRGMRAPNDWEYGVIIGKLQARIGRYQIALWWGYEAIFNRYWAPTLAMSSNPPGSGGTPPPPSPPSPPPPSPPGPIERPRPRPR